ncbi:MAG: hypothetical protein QF507_04670, partial [Vicinamibacterales bacterium]|nr:hypothetical protein [Vicinamibacterales bacterium]
MRLIQSTRSITSWTVYPATMVVAFIINATLLSAGLPILSASYVTVVVAAGAVTLFEFVIPYDKTWQ